MDQTSILKREEEKDQGDVSPALEYPYSKRIREIMLAQPLNPLRRIRFSILTLADRYIIGAKPPAEGGAS